MSGAEADSGTSTLRLKAIARLQSLSKNLDEFLNGPANDLAPPEKNSRAAASGRKKDRKRSPGATSSSSAAADPAAASASDEDVDEVEEEPVVDFSWGSSSSSSAAASSEASESSDESSDASSSSAGVRAPEAPASSSSSALRMPSGHQLQSTRVILAETEYVDDEKEVEVAAGGAGKEVEVSKADALSTDPAAVGEAASSDDLREGEGAAVTADASRVPFERSDSSGSAGMASSGKKKSDDHRRSASRRRAAKKEKKAHKKERKRRSAAVVASLESSTSAGNEEARATAGRFVSEVLGLAPEQRSADDTVRLMVDVAKRLREENQALQETVKVKEDAVLSLRLSIEQMEGLLRVTGIGGSATADGDAAPQAMPTRPPNAMRLRALEEIVSTERNYVEMLGHAIESYMQPLGRAAVTASTFNVYDIEKLFSNMELIWGLNMEFSNALAYRISLQMGCDASVGDIFIKLIPMFGIYSKYYRKYDESIELLTRLRGQDEFISFVHILDTKMAAVLKVSAVPDLKTYLYRPCQRLFQYALLLQQLLKYTEADHPDCSNLVLANNQLANLLERVNERTRFQRSKRRIRDLQLTIRDFGLLPANYNRLYVTEGALHLVDDSNKKPTHTYTFREAKRTAGLLLKQSSKLGRAKPFTTVQVFLFNDLFLLTKRTRLAHNSADAAGGGAPGTETGSASTATSSAGGGSMISSSNAAGGAASGPSATSGGSSVAGGTGGGSSGTGIPGLVSSSLRIVRVVHFRDIASADGGAAVPSSLGDELEQTGILLKLRGGDDAQSLLLVPPNSREHQRWLRALEEVRLLRGGTQTEEPVAAVSAVAESSSSSPSGRNRGITQVGMQAMVRSRVGPALPFNIK